MAVLSVCLMYKHCVGQLTGGQGQDFPLPAYGVGTGQMDRIRDRIIHDKTLHTWLWLVVLYTQNGDKKKKKMAGWLGRQARQAGEGSLLTFTLLKNFETFTETEKSLFCSGLLFHCSHFPLLFLS